MGIRPITYWLGTFLFDILVTLFTNLVGIFSYSFLYNYMIENPTPGFLPRELGDMFMLFTGFGFGVVTYAYLWSFMFDRALSAVKYFPVLFYFVMYLGSELIVLIVLVAVAGRDGSNVDAIQNSAALRIATYLAYILSPAYVYNNGVIVLPSGLPSFVSSMGGYLGIQFGVGLFYFIMVFILDTRKNSFKKETVYNLAPENDLAPIDYNEINFEAERTKNSQTDAIKVLDL